MAYKYWILFVLFVCWIANTVKSADETDSPVATEQQNSPALSPSRIDSLLLPIGPQIIITPEQARIFVYLMLTYIEKLKSAQREELHGISERMLLLLLARESGHLILHPLLEKLTELEFGNELKEFMREMSVRCAALFPPDFGFSSERNSARNLCHLGIVFSLARSIADKFFVWTTRNMRDQLRAQRQSQIAQRRGSELRNFFRESFQLLLSCFQQIPAEQPVVEMEVSNEHGRIETAENDQPIYGPVHVEHQMTTNDAQPIYGPVHVEHQMTTNDAQSSRPQPVQPPQLPRLSFSDLLSNSILHVRVAHSFEMALTHWEEIRAIALRMLIANPEIRGIVSSFQKDLFVQFASSSFEVSYN